MNVENLATIEQLRSLQNNELQEWIYRSASKFSTNPSLKRLMDELKSLGLIEYDRDELWYRPTSDIGKPIEMSLYRQCFPLVD